MSNNKDKWYGVGNFQFGIERMNGVDYMVCRTVTRDWQIRFSQEMYLYGVTSRLVEEGESRMLVNLAVFWYSNTAMLHSADYYRETTERMMREIAEAEHPDVPREKDDEMLQEVAEMEEIREELEKLDKEDADTE